MPADYWRTVMSSPCDPQRDPPRELRRLAQDWRCAGLGRASAGPKRFLVTGSAGFIGFHLCRLLLEQGHRVAGLDAIPMIGPARSACERRSILREYSGYAEAAIELDDARALSLVCEDHQPQIFVHLGAHAPIRDAASVGRPQLDPGAAGAFNIMEAARAFQAQHLLIASTSSIYPAISATPCRETDSVDACLAPYAAERRAIELMAHAHSHLWKMPTTVFRFSGAFGPHGHARMTPLALADAVEADAAPSPRGQAARRDLTCVGDLVTAIELLSRQAPTEGRPVAGDSLSPVAPWRIVNIGPSEPVGPLDLAAQIRSRASGDGARISLPLDGPPCPTDSTLLQVLTGFRPQTPLATAVERLCQWHRESPARAAAAQSGDRPALARGARAAAPRRQRVHAQSTLRVSA